MSKLNENFFDIKDLYVVKFKPEYSMNSFGKGEDTRYYNPNFQFIMEKFTIYDKSGKNLEIEIYTECLTNEDITKRENSNITSEIPELFKSVEEFPKEYLTQEELKTGVISTLRLFKIFQELNEKSLRSNLDENLEKGKTMKKVINERNN